MGLSISNFVQDYNPLTILSDKRVFFFSPLSSSCIPKLRNTRLYLGTVCMGFQPNPHKWRSMGLVDWLGPLTLDHKVRGWSYVPKSDTQRFHSWSHSLIIIIKYEPQHDKTNKMNVCPAKTQISLGICPVWSESSLCAQWVAADPMFLHADSEDADQTGQMPRLIWVFAGRTATLLVLSCRGSYTSDENINIEWERYVLQLEQGMESLWRQDFLEPQLSFISQTSVNLPLTWYDWLLILTDITDYGWEVQNCLPRSVCGIFRFIALFYSNDFIWCDWEFLKPPWNYKKY